MLADAPLCTKNTQQALVDEVVGLVKDNVELRHTILGLCGDKRDDGPRAKYDADGTVPSTALVRHIVRHNNQLLGSPPIDGESSNTEAWGIWPLAAVINHSLRPNVARFTVGHMVCYRLLKDVAQGEEVLSNYLDPLMSRVARVELLGVHEIEDEGPDDLDAPEEVLVDLEKKVQEAEKAMSESRPQDALGVLAEATSAICDSERKDPAFAVAFKAFAQVAGCLKGGATMQLEGLAMALEHVASSREQASVVSCAMSAEILALAVGELPKDDVEHIEVKARDHVRRVYGEAKGMFEALNPSLARRLGGAGESAEAPTDSKNSSVADSTVASDADGAKKRELEGDVQAETNAKKAKTSDGK